ncbi:MAG: TolC family protein [Clostridiaceae bacterium]|nr:TolC family protein [Clostridiaceae bacterium]
MKNKKRLITIGLLCILFFTSATSSFAAETQSTLHLTLEEAVITGLENSIILDQVQAEIDLADVARRRARFSTRRLDRGRDNLRDANRELSQAESLLNQGILPKDITLADGSTLPAGTRLQDTDLSSDVQSSITNNIQQSLDASRQQLHQGDLKIINALQEAGGTISQQLDFASLDSLSLDGTTDLLNTMTEVSLEVTEASYNIYKNNIALLIQKSYYDVLQAQQMLGVKAKAMERGRTQYEFAKASYEEGLKPKDDMLMASVYYRGTQIEHEKAKGDLENSLFELKKNMNIPLDTEIKLIDVLIEEKEDFDLHSGLIAGMQNRLEVKKALGEFIVYDLNFTETKSKYPSNTFQHQEAELLRTKTELQFQQTKLEVESSIRQSYTTVNTVASMLEASNEMVKEAQENVAIAEYKYKEGFGVETSLLKNLNLEDSAGTIVEVLAAEENLAKVEEQIVKITYAYNLARMQHLNNTGNFIY